MLRFFRFFILILVLLINAGCQNTDRTEKVDINGYDKIQWDMDIKSLKELLNNSYSANLYDFYNINNGDTTLYNFNSGKFKGFDVYKWEVKYIKEKLVEVKLFFYELNQTEKIIDEFIKKRNKKDKFPFEKKLYSNKTEKPVSIIKLSKINQFIILSIQKQN